jgi:hypothetical protein
MVGCLLLGLFQPIYFSTLVCYIAREKKMAARRETTLVAGCRGVSICSCVVSIRSSGLAMAHDSWRERKRQVKDNRLSTATKKGDSSFPSREKASLFSVEAFYFILFFRRLDYLCHELETDFFPRLFSRSLASSCSSLTPM